MLPLIMSEAKTPLEDESTSVSQEPVEEDENLSDTDSHAGSERYAASEAGSETPSISDKSSLRNSRSTSNTPTNTRSTRSRDNPEFVAKQKSFMAKVQAATAGVDVPMMRPDTPGKRKRESSASSTQSSSKKRKSGKTDNNGQEYQNDNYCWECHREGVFICCEMCPRVFHLKCAGLEKEPEEDWACSECHAVMQAENIENRSRAMQLISVEQLCTLLKFALNRLKTMPGMEPFTKPVDTNEFPTYADVVVHPVDFTSLERNIKRKFYGSTEAFSSDARWIVHNSVIFNGANSKVTSMARTLVKILKQDMSEIETCPDCYMNAHQKPDSWFTEACRSAHPLIWARLKGFPFWPAKAVKWKDGNVDVRFFGRHDRSWVPVKECFLFSEQMPTPLKNRNKTLESCLQEVNDHIAKLRERFGRFRYAPHRVQFNPLDQDQIKIMLPSYKGPIPLRMRAQARAFSRLSGQSDDETSSVASTDSGTSSRRRKRESGTSSATQETETEAELPSQSSIQDDDERTEESSLTKLEEGEETKPKDRESQREKKLESKVKEMLPSDNASIKSDNHDSDDDMECEGYPRGNYDDDDDDDEFSLINGQSALLEKDSKETSVPKKPKPKLIRRYDFKLDETENKSTPLVESEVVGKHNDKLKENEAKEEVEDEEDDSMVYRDDDEDEELGRLALSAEGEDALGLEEEDTKESDGEEKKELEEEKDKTIAKIWLKDNLTSDSKLTPIASDLDKSSEKESGNSSTCTKVVDSSSLLENVKVASIDSIELKVKECNKQSDKKDGESSGEEKQIKDIMNSTKEKTLGHMSLVTDKLISELPALIKLEKFSDSEYNRTKANEKLDSELFKDQVGQSSDKSNIESSGGGGGCKKAEGNITMKSSDNIENASDKVEKDSKCVSNKDDIIKDKVSTKIEKKDDDGSGDESDVERSLCIDRDNDSDEESDVEMKQLLNSNSVNDSRSIEGESDRSSSVNDDKSKISLYKNNKLSDKSDSESEKETEDELEKIKREFASRMGISITFKDNEKKESSVLSKKEKEKMEVDSDEDTSSEKEKEKEQLQNTDKESRNKSFSSKSKESSKQQDDESGKEALIDAVQLMKNLRTIAITKLLDRPLEGDSPNEGVTVSLTRDQIKTENNEERNGEAENSGKTSPNSGRQTPNLKHSDRRDMEDHISSLGCSVSVTKAVDKEKDKERTRDRDKDKDKIRERNKEKDKERDKEKDKERVKMPSGVDTTRLSPSISIIAVSGTTERQRAKTTIAPSASPNPNHSSLTASGQNAPRSSPAVSASSEPSSCAQPNVPPRVSSASSLSSPHTGSGGGIPPPPPLSHPQASPSGSASSRGVFGPPPPGSQVLGLTNSRAPMMSSPGIRMMTGPGPALMFPNRLPGLPPTRHLPPEAGPLATQLHKHSQKLAEVMRATLEDVLGGLVGTGTPEARVAALQLELERTSWRHQQELAEVRHNADVMLVEMRANLEAEKQRAVEEVKRQMEQQLVEVRRQMERQMVERMGELKRQMEAERQRAVEETKKKQWCANCGKEALFFCCWNTSYCDYPCQQSHWPQHMSVCGQNSDSGGGGGGEGGSDSVNGEASAQSSRVSTPVQSLGPGQFTDEEGAVSLAEELRRRKHREDDVGSLTSSILAQCLIKGNRERPRKKVKSSSKSGSSKAKEIANTSPKPPKSPKAWMEWFLEQSGAEGIKENLNVTPKVAKSKSRKPSSKVPEGMRKKRKSTPCIRRKIEHILTPDEVTAEMLDRVATRSKDKQHDQENGTSCHQCRQKTADSKTICRSGKCVGLRGFFCGPCLGTRYGEDAKKALLDPTWACPVCRGICNCSLCRKAFGQQAVGQIVQRLGKMGYSSVQQYLESKTDGDSQDDPPKLGPDKGSDDEGAEVDTQMKITKDEKMDSGDESEGEMTLAM